MTDKSLLVLSTVPEDNSVGWSVQHYNGVVRALTDEKTRQYFTFDYSRVDTLIPGNKYTVYGTIDHYYNITTETGLKYEVPYLVSNCTNYTTYYEFESQRHHVYATQKDVPLPGKN